LLVLIRFGLIRVELVWLGLIEACATFPWNDSQSFSDKLWSYQRSLSNGVLESYSGRAQRQCSLSPRLLPTAKHSTAHLRMRPSALKSCFPAPFPILARFSPVAIGAQQAASSPPAPDLSQSVTRRLIAALLLWDHAPSVAKRHRQRWRKNSRRQQAQLEELPTTTTTATPTDAINGPPEHR